MTNRNKLREAAERAKPIIKKWEGLELKTYKAPEGAPTIGYGHTGSAAYYGNTITEAQANTLLNMDIAEAQKGIPSALVSALNVNQLAAITSFIFNVGAGNFASSTLRRKLLEGDYTGASEEFKRWKFATVNGVKTELAGLVKRRAEETALFLENPLKKKS